MGFIRRHLYYFKSIASLITGFHNPLPVLGVVALYVISTMMGDMDDPMLVMWMMNWLIPARPFQVRLKHSGHVFDVRGVMDIWSIKETFIDGFYERFGFKIQPGWTVIDIGAGVGDFTLFASHVPGTHVYAFEPFPESFELLAKNVFSNRVPHVEAFSHAVASVAGSLLLELDSGEPLQFQSRTAPIMRPESQITVPARSLSEILDWYQLESCDLLKLDCEGAEYDILMHSPPDALNKIQRIVMEYHDNMTPYTHEDLRQFLTREGFKVQVYANLAHKDIGYLRAER